MIFIPRRFCSERNWIWLETKSSLSVRIISPDINGIADKALVYESVALAVKAILDGAQLKSWEAWV
jgi:hypothetical protein